MEGFCEQVVTNSSNFITFFSSYDKFIGEHGCAHGSIDTKNCNCTLISESMSTLCHDIPISRNRLSCMYFSFEILQRNWNVAWDNCSKAGHTPTSANVCISYCTVMCKHQDKPTKRTIEARKVVYLQEALDCVSYRYEGCNFRKSMEFVVSQIKLWPVAFV